MSYYTNQKRSFNLGQKNSLIMEFTNNNTSLHTPFKIINSNLNNVNFQSKLTSNSNNQISFSQNDNIDQSNSQQTNNTIKNNNKNEINSNKAFENSKKEAPSYDLYDFGYMEKNIIDLTQQQNSNNTIKDKSSLIKSKNASMAKVVNHLIENPVFDKEGINNDSSKCNKSGLNSRNPNSNSNPILKNLQNLIQTKDINISEYERKVEKQFRLKSEYSMKARLTLLNNTKEKENQYNSHSLGDNRLFNSNFKNININNNNNELYFNNNENKSNLKNTYFKDNKTITSIIKENQSNYINENTKSIIAILTKGKHESEANDDETDKKLLHYDSAKNVFCKNNSKKSNNNHSNEVFREVIQEVEELETKNKFFNLNKQKNEFTVKNYNNNNSNNNIHSSRKVEKDILNSQNQNNSKSTISTGKLIKSNNQTNNINQEAIECLYNPPRKSINKQLKIIEEKKQKELMELKECSFKPKINTENLVKLSNNKKRNSNDSKKVIVNQKIYSKAKIVPISKENIINSGQIMEINNNSNNNNNNYLEEKAATIFEIKTGNNHDIEELDIDSFINQYDCKLPESSLSKGKEKSESKFNEYYNRQLNWKKGTQCKIDKDKEQLELRILEQHTFNPTTNKSINDRILNNGFNDDDNFNLFYMDKNNLKYFERIQAAKNQKIENKERAMPNYSKMWEVNKKKGKRNSVDAILSAYDGDNNNRTPGNPGELFDINSHNINNPLASEFILRDDSNLINNRDLVSEFKQQCNEPDQNPENLNIEKNNLYNVVGNKEKMNINNNFLINNNYYISNSTNNNKIEDKKNTKGAFGGLITPDIETNEKNFGLISKEVIESAQAQSSKSPKEEGNLEHLDLGNTYDALYSNSLMKNDNNIENLNSKNTFNKLNLVDDPISKNNNNEKVLLIKDINIQDNNNIDNNKQVFSKRLIKNTKNSHIKSEETNKFGAEKASTEEINNSKILEAEFCKEEISNKIQKQSKYTLSNYSNFDTKMFLNDIKREVTNKIKLNEHLENNNNTNNNTSNSNSNNNNNNFIDMGNYVTFSQDEIDQHLKNKLQRKPDTYYDLKPNLNNHLGNNLLLVNDEISKYKINNNNNNININIPSFGNDNTNPQFQESNIKTDQSNNNNQKQNLCINHLSNNNNIERNESNKDKLLLQVKSSDSNTKNLLLDNNNNDMPNILELKSKNNNNNNIENEVNNNIFSNSILNDNDISNINPLNLNSNSFYDYHRNEINIPLQMDSKKTTPNNELQLALGSSKNETFKKNNKPAEFMNSIINDSISLPISMNTSMDGRMSVPEQEFKFEEKSNFKENIQNHKIYIKASLKDKMKEPNILINKYNAKTYDYNLDEDSLNPESILVKEMNKQEFNNNNILK